MESSFKPHHLDWVVERLRETDSYVERPMFGCRACYLMGELKLVLAGPGDEPWNGVLVATSKEHHPSLLTQFPELHNHPVLPKWLYISEDSEEFERVVVRLAQLVGKLDKRIGVLPSERKRRKVKKRG